MSCAYTFGLNKILQKIQEVVTGMEFKPYYAIEHRVKDISGNFCCTEGTQERPGIAVTGVGCYRAVLCKTVIVMAKSPIAVLSKSTKETTDDTTPSMHANYAIYVQKSLFVPLKLFNASSQLFF